MKKAFKNMDKPLFFAVTILCLIGLIMVFSSSSVITVLKMKVSATYYFKRQLLFMIVSFLFGFIYILNRPISTYNKFRSVMVIAIVGMLTAVLIYGTIANSAKSWIRLGSVTLQPSEFAKAGLIMFIASFYGKYLKTKFRFAFLIPVAVGVITCLLVFLQPDLGTTIIIVLLVFFLFMSVPFDKNNKLINGFKIAGWVGLIAGILLMTVGGNLLNSMQAGRLIYRKPCTRYTEATGYQVCNGMIAINNGGLFGVGLGNSTQKYLYLPEAHTDFIFPIIVEELGSVVGVGIILLYLFIMVRLIRIAKKSSDLNGSLIAYGTAILLFLHIAVNLGGILALIPLTGVPLPLLSYGGSSVISTLSLIFLSLRVSIENNLNKSKVKK